MYKIRKDGIVVGILNIISGIILCTLGIVYFVYNKGSITLKTPIIDILTTWGLLKPILVFVGFEVLFIIITLIGIKSIKSAVKITPENKVKKSSYILSIILTSGKLIAGIVLAIILKDLVLKNLNLINFCAILGVLCLSIATIILDIKTLAKNKIKKE